MSVDLRAAIKYEGSIDINNYRVETLVISHCISIIEILFVELDGSYSVEPERALRAW
jgi:hypothetical protein